MKILKKPEKNKKVGYFSGDEMLFDVNPQGKTMQLIYFLLKSGAGKADEKLVISRLEENWKKSGGRARVMFSMDKVGGRSALNRRPCCLC